MEITELVREVMNLGEKDKEVLRIVLNASKKNVTTVVSKPLRGRKNGKATDETIDKFIILQSKGLSMKAIGAEIGISPAYMYTRNFKSKVNARMSKFTPPVEKKSFFG